MRLARLCSEEASVGWAFLLFPFVMKQRVALSSSRLKLMLLQTSLKQVVEARDWFKELVAFWL